MPSSRNDFSPRFQWYIFLCFQNEAFWELPYIRTKAWSAHPFTLFSIRFSNTREVLSSPRHSCSRCSGCSKTGSQAGAAKPPGRLVAENTSASQPNKLYPSNLFLSFGQCFESHGHVVWLSQLKIQSCLVVGIMEIIEVINIYAKLFNLV